MPTSKHTASRCHVSTCRKKNYLLSTPTFGRVSVL